MNKQRSNIARNLLNDTLLYLNDVKWSPARYRTRAKRYCYQCFSSCCQARVWVWDWEWWTSIARERQKPQITCPHVTSRHRLSNSAILNGAADWPNRRTDGKRLTSVGGQSRSFRDVVVPRGLPSSAAILC